MGGSRGGRGLSGWLARRPWLATGVATAGIVLVLGLQAFGAQDKPRECGGRPCPVSTTAAVAAGEGDGSRIGTPLTTVVEPTTSSTVNAGPAAAPTATPPASAVTAPPTTRPGDHRRPDHQRVPADDHHKGHDHDRADDHAPDDDHHGRAGAALAAHRRPYT